MNNNKRSLLLLWILYTGLSYAQTQTIVYVTNTTDWLAFNGSAAQAGSGWNLLSYSTQGWTAPFNGLGRTGTDACPAPYSVPANQSNNPLGVAVPVIWTRQFGAPFDYACFRRKINLPSCGRVVSATIDFGSDDFATLFVNGIQIGTSSSLNGHTNINLNNQQFCQYFVNGDNVIAAEVNDNRLSCLGFHFGIKLVIDTTNLVNIDDESAFVYPSAFTPNEDGNNDIFFVMGKEVKDVSFSIFNRWGEKVFESNGLSEGWDGKYKGEMQPAGVYVLSATASFSNGKTIRKIDSITLIH